MNNPATMHPRQPNWLGCIRFVVGFFGALIAFTPGKSADVAEESTGWELLSQYRFNEALLAFEQNSVTGDDSNRSIGLGEALSRLVSPSYNEADLPIIVSELEQIWQSNSRDKAGLWAGYYLGRISQNHASANADYDAALTWYERVATAGGDDLLAQMARLKAVGLILFAPLDAALSTEERFQQSQELVAKISEPHLQMNALLVLANGMLYRDAAPDRVLPSLQSAWRLGVTDPTARAQLLVQMGNLATKVGKPNLAAECYQQFLEEFPTEKRNQMVREQLALLSTDE
jgi:tetratricopeptide (TPR) repeat protein